jgi:hypothetical protein
MPRNRSSYLPICTTTVLLTGKALSRDLILNKYLQRAPLDHPLKSNESANSSRQYSRKKGQYKLKRQASNSHWSTKQHLSGQISLCNIYNWRLFMCKTFAMIYRQTLPVDVSRIPSGVSRHHPYPSQLDPVDCEGGSEGK